MNPRSLLFATAFAVTWANYTAAQQDHGHGTSKGPVAKSAVAIKSPPALEPAEVASIKILAPTKGQTFKGDKVEIHYKLTKGKRGHHAHAYVDGALLGMFESEKGTLNGIKPGKHILELRVVADDHTTELDAKDRAEFAVQ